MPKCLTLDEYNAGKVLCGFSYGILGHPVYTLEQRRKIVSDEVFEQVMRFARREPLALSTDSNNQLIVHCQHCGHLV